MLLVSNQVIYLRWKAPITYSALEGPLFGMRSVMNFQGRIAGEGLEAELTSCVATSYSKKRRFHFNGQSRFKFIFFEKLTTLWHHNIKLLFLAWYFWMYTLSGQSNALRNMYQSHPEKFGKIWKNSEKNSEKFRKIQKNSDQFRSIQINSDNFR